MPGPVATTLLFLAAGAGAVVLLSGCAVIVKQERVIYRPRSYTAVELTEFPKGTVPIRHTTSQGEQRGWYVPRRDGLSAPPTRVWILCGGQGALAVDWSTFIANFPEDDVAWYVPDYPGYGGNPGRPSPETIEESLVAGYDALAAHLGITRAELDARAGILGMSLGGGTCLLLARNVGAKHIVLVGTFTRLEELARGVTAYLAPVFLRHRYNNEARLAELAAREKPPRVVLVHGTVDNTIPPTMSERLAAPHPTMCEVHLVKRAGHYDIVTDYRDAVYQVMDDGGTPALSFTAGDD